MYQLNGGVAQLEEHLTGSQKVVGSSPITSTIKVILKPRLRKTGILWIDTSLSLKLWFLYVVLRRA